LDKPDKYWNFVLQLKRYCNYQERCTAEINRKMFQLDVPVEWQSEILDYLIENNLLNEKRFAISYSIGKIRNNYWGKQKILASLKQKKIDTSLINEAFKFVDDEEYLSILRHIMNIKIGKIGDISIDKNKKKLLNYALQKGFESSLIWQVIKEIELNNKYGN